MESSRREFFIVMVVYKFTFNYNLIKLIACFTFIPKIGVGLTGVGCYCVCLCLVLFVRSSFIVHFILLI